MITVLSYQHYREFLKDFYLDQKKRKTGLTYASFSKQAGVNSPNYLKLVMDGQKNLTSENIVRFSRALKLKEHESDYFEALVHFNQAKDPMEREYYEERVKRIRRRLKQTGDQDRTLEEHEFEIMSNWVYHAIMVLTNVQGFRESPTWIRERLFNLVSEKEIGLALERLVQLKLLSRGEDGRLVQTHRQVKTKAELRKLTSQVFYEGLLGRAIHAVRVTEPEEREFGACLVGLSPKQLPELKRRVREFIQSLNEWALENPKPLQVYSLTFCGFPLTSAEGRRFQ